MPQSHISEGEFQVQRTIINKSRVKNLPKRVLKDIKSRIDSRAQIVKTPVNRLSKRTVWSNLQLIWFNQLLNTEQKEAVRRILRGQARPLPYIIFGPPGTGKTVTVVEAIMQIYALDPNSRVLVAAPSNSAADNIAEYLARSNLFYPGDFVRLVGFKRADQQMSDVLEAYCRDGNDLETVTKHRIVISTCTTAGQFMTMNLCSGYFSHVFIDEAGYCSEPETLIPCVLVAINNGGQVILAGDPQQLGPVLMSPEAMKCELGVSFLERIMQIPIYERMESKHPETKYNPLLVTKLLKNYRAHEILLKIPSKLFYENELQPFAPQSEYKLCQNELLSAFIVTKVGMPLVFHGIQGDCKKDGDSTSSYNPQEVLAVVDYLKILRELGVESEDIGVISPYRKQVEIIRSTYRFHREASGSGSDSNMPKMGSVEEFQGGEKSVIIISAVRSLQEGKVDVAVQQGNLDFVFSPKRFNVAITRAKSLLIIVGNPHVLWKDSNWNELIKYCIDIGAYKGCNLPLELDLSAQVVLLKMAEAIGRPY